MSTTNKLINSFIYLSFVNDIYRRYISNYILYPLSRRTFLP